MPRTAIWKSILDTLRAEIGTGRYRVGDKLPTEAELSRRFGVNRHTVRRALAGMAESGLVHPRRGAGVFVAAPPTDYPLGRRVRFHQNLRAAGQTPDKTILLIETRLPDRAETTALHLRDGAQVHAYEGISLANGTPLALFRSVFPAARFPTLPQDLEETPSVTAALSRGGVADYTRASSRLTAKLATATQALHLRIREGAPILRTIGINVDETGQPVEYGHTWFAGDRISLTIAPE
ncbi:GntR family phosphonate transport system transcriptional regulator [Rhodovulum imhoffii]|uniref:GntR family phosphonate transport system transcriptional regulator n=1 Tax=Rhodovulum imhoffii TaxID=365340 RepID=A0A2T5BPS7_9RHOB|nr:phosphonate metabolism transcriptional regulator PhnF [Rhodovulum imhoffii]MBK5933072.1 phosphonate metabolism transcriptional regulator PhnF [Rhodovulum imhoffii]PTN01072.1 GntR family phosphonate transport system transcriptional regulator [Rhodovulum imhoffii]